MEITQEFVNLFKANGPEDYVNIKFSQGNIYTFPRRLVYAIFRNNTLINAGLDFSNEKITALEFYKLIYGHLLPEKITEDLFMFIEKWIPIKDIEECDVRKYFTTCYTLYLRPILHKNKSFINYCMLVYYLSGEKVTHNLQINCGGYPNIFLSCYQFYIEYNDVRIIKYTFSQNSDDYDKLVKKNMFGLIRNTLTTIISEGKWLKMFRQDISNYSPLIQSVIPDILINGYMSEQIISADEYSIDWIKQNVFSY